MLLLPLERTTLADNECSLPGGGHSEMNCCGGRRPNDVGINHSDQQAPKLDKQEVAQGVPNPLRTTGQPEGLVRVWVSLNAAHDEAPPIRQ